MQSAHHVIGCHQTQETRVNNACDDVASTVHQSLNAGRAAVLPSRCRVDASQRVHLLVSHPTLNPSLTGFPPSRVYCYSIFPTSHTPLTCCVATFISPILLLHHTSITSLHFHRRCCDKTTAAAPRLTPPPSPHPSVVVAPSTGCRRGRTGASRWCTSAASAAMLWWGRGIGHCWRV
jgi:hypothetical protein